MKEVIIGETNKVFIKSLERFAKQNDQDIKDIQLVISLDESDELFYQICIKGVPQSNVTLKEILGIKTIDFKGYTMFIPPYLMQIMSKLINEQQNKDVKVVICYNTTREYCAYFLFCEKKKVREIYLNDLIE